MLCTRISMFLTLKFRKKSYRFLDYQLLLDMYFRIITFGHLLCWKVVLIMTLTAKCSRSTIVQDREYFSTKKHRLCKQYPTHNLWTNTQKSGTFLHWKHKAGSELEWNRDDSSSNVYLYLGRECRSSFLDKMLGI